jgi:carboxymethylenebutenolidase
MCHEPTARPPLPPIAGGAGVEGTQRLVLEATDGNRFRAFTAGAAGLDAPAVVILPDVRGLHPFYEDLALRFAEAGVHATAIDYFGRTAGTSDRDDDFEYRPHVDRMTPEGTRADVTAAIAHVRSDASGGAERVFVVGFCRGGRIAFWQAAEQDLDGVIGFYGWPKGGRPDDPLAPIAVVSSYRCPVLGLFGGADGGIPVEDVEEFRRTLEEAGVPNEIVVYEGAPHSFFDRAFDEHREACDDAWRRVLAFVTADDASVARR